MPSVSPDGLIFALCRRLPRPVGGPHQPRAAAASEGGAGRADQNEGAHPQTPADLPAPLAHREIRRSEMPIATFSRFA